MFHIYSDKGILHICYNYLQAYSYILPRAHNELLILLPKASYLLISQVLHNHFTPLHKVLYIFYIRTLSIHDEIFITSSQLSSTQLQMFVWS